MMGFNQARVPIPLDCAEDVPVYVNTKQFRAILRRRQMRAKLEAQNKIAKSRKVFLSFKLSAFGPTIFGLEFIHICSFCVAISTRVSAYSCIKETKGIWWAFLECEAN